MNKLAAASQGQNVNDLITVSNQYIEEGQNNDGIIRAHEDEPIHIIQILLSMMLLIVGIQ